MRYGTYQSYYNGVHPTPIAPAPMTTSTPAAADGENASALYTALRIFGLVVLLRFVGLFFEGVQRGEARFEWLPADLAAPTSVLVRVEKRRGTELYINDGAYGALFDAAHIGWR